MKLLAALAAALVVAAPAAAAPARTLTANTEWLALEGADGLAVVSGRGALLGRLDRGFIVVREIRGAPDPRVNVAGESRRVELGPRRTLYEGRDLSFRIYGDRWRLDVAGVSIHLSAAVQAYVSAKGRSGTISLPGDPERALPDAWQTFVLDRPQDGWRPTRRSVLAHEIRWLRLRGFTWPQVKQTEVWRLYSVLAD